MTCMCVLVGAVWRGFGVEKLDFLHERVSDPDSFWDELVFV